MKSQDLRFDDDPAAGKKMPADPTEPKEILPPNPSGTLPLPKDSSAGPDEFEAEERHPAAGLFAENSSSATPVKTAWRKKTVDHKDHVRLKSLRAEIDRLRQTLRRTEAEAAAAREEAAALNRDVLEWKEKALRTLADTDNLRKRLERDKNEYFQFALTDILKDILQVLDNLDRALRSEDSAGGSFREGVELIRKQINDLIAKRGVTPIERPDGRFDPAVHQALTTEEVEGIEEPMIGMELQKGYWLNDRLLRPALVNVLIPKKN